MVYQDRIETNFYRVFKNIFEINIVVEQKQAYLITISLFIIFH